MRIFLIIEFLEEDEEIRHSLVILKEDSSEVTASQVLRRHILKKYSYVYEPLLWPGEDQKVAGYMIDSEKVAEYKIDSEAEDIAEIRVHELGQEDIDFVSVSDFNK